MTYMARQTTVRFTDNDLALLDAVRKRTGIVSRTEVLRRAIRALAEREGVSQVDPERKRPRKGR